MFLIFSFLNFQAWVGHPYVDIVDNLSDFESKIRSLISKVAWSIGIDIGDRLTTGARKLKFVVNGPLPSEKAFPEGFRDFEVRFFSVISVLKLAGVELI